ncbi:unnamed protein product, partial [Aureobasidium pullulans]
MSWMDRERFLEGFTYEVEKDFDVNSTPSSWADAELSLAHRYWGDEDHRIELPHPDDHTCRLSTSALTPDKKFIAASNGFVVNLYDVATKETTTSASRNIPTIPLGHLRMRDKHKHVTRISLCLHSIPLPIKHLLHDTDLLTSWTHVVAAFPTTHLSGIPSENAGYALFTYALSCLAGNTESGRLVRAYLMHGSNLPTWRNPECTTQQPSLKMTGS